MTASPDPARLRPLPAGAFGSAAVAGLVGGWLLRPIGERLWVSAPLVGWLQVAMIGFVALILLATARATWRSVRDDREPPEPHRMVNRLVLGRACALVGALVAGGYAGYAVSWIGISAELADQRMLRSLVAAAAGVVMMIGGIALERACRTPGDPDEPPQAPDPR